MASGSAGLHAAADAAWREPAQIAAQWEDAARTDGRLLRARVQGDFWAVLEAAEVTLIVTREYEHLLAGLSVSRGKAYASYMRLPHPSGVAVGSDRVYVASTRNPNQLYELRPVTGAVERTDVPAPAAAERPLVPVRSAFYPGSLYLHDLAFVGGDLHGNAVGHNAVVRFEDAGYRRVWWPKAIETAGRPDFTRNYLQLNSIAAGRDLAGSFFSASAARPGRRRPGHRNFPVDGRGVIFSGATREPVAGGLTRPHSARLAAGGLWVANSGYGELGRIEDGAFVSVARLPGWTRGLTFAGEVAFAGVSRVLPRFRAYAPGLDVDRSRCGVYAVDTRTGSILGSLIWPYGNQIFSIEWMPRTFSEGFAFAVARRRSRRLRDLFYSFDAAGWRGDEPD